MLANHEVQGGNAAAEHLEAEELPAKVTLVGWTEDEQGQIDQIHVGGNGHQLVPTQVVFGQAMPWTGVESKQLGNRV